MKHILCASVAAGLLLGSGSAQAQDHSNHTGHQHHNAYAPISVMGDHMHKKGEWMTSYRYSRMEMDGNRIGTNDISPEQIVTTITNPNGPPANLRVVPTEMSMDMHMLGAMYGVTDWLTLSLMAMYMEKEMDHVTFQGGAGTTQLGTFTTKSSGWGDTSINSMIRLYDDNTHHMHLNAGLSLPTGSIKKGDDVLAPTGATPTLRLPYAMQLGSGTYDFLPGVTYTGQKNVWGWGAQYKAVIRLEDENSQNYSWGNRHNFTAWGSYQALPWLSGNTRLSLETMDEIDGSDTLIAAPVQTADPNNYGGEIAEASLGFNITPTQARLSGHQIGIEATLPIYQDLNGPQMKRDWGVTAGWIIRF